jgi:HAD superfamily hydrolase (TIGR01450 family)
MTHASHFFLDLEGTLVQDKNYEPIPGAVDWVCALREMDRTVLVASNNTTHPIRHVQQRLAGHGFCIEESDILTCSGVGMEILREWGATRCFVIGEDPLREMLREAGFRVQDEGPVDAVLVGLDRGLTYARLSSAVDILVQLKVPLLALHYNRLYLDVGGTRGPSVGAIVRALEYAAGVQAIVAGKPSSRFYDTALRITSAEPGDVLFVSDDPLSDLVGAKRAGIQTAFVLSGKYPTDEVLQSVEPGMRPDIVASSIGEIEVGE